MKKRVTQFDIAKKCGVSLKLVSTILSGKKSKYVRFSPETRDMVLETARKLNYRPNRSAQNLFSNRHNAIGFLIDDLMYIPPMAVKNIIKEAKEFGQFVIFEQISWETDHTAAFFDQDSVDGLIIFESVNTTVFRKIKEFGIPCLSVNTDPQPGIPRIAFNEESSMDLAAEFVASKGKKNPLLFLFEKEHYSNKARIESFRKTAGKYNLNPPAVVTHTDHFSITSDLLGTFREYPEFDSIITDDGMLSLGLEVCRKLKKTAENGLEVLAIDNFGSAKDNWCAVYARLHVNMEKLAQTVVRELNSMISGNPAQDFSMNYELVQEGVFS